MIDIINFCLMEYKEILYEEITLVEYRDNDTGIDKIVDMLSETILKNELGSDKTLLVFIKDNNKLIIGEEQIVMFLNNHPKNYTVIANKSISINASGEDIYIPILLVRTQS